MNVNENVKQILILYNRIYLGDKSDVYLFVQPSVLSSVLPSFRPSALLTVPQSLT